MKEFYCILGRSIAPQEALGRAKISLLHSGQRVVAPIPPFRRDSLAERAIAIEERAVSIGRTPEK